MKSKITLEFDITLEAIFQRRRFTALRVLEFEGVKADPERLEEIQGMLADLGLEEISVGYPSPEWGKYDILVFDSLVKDMVEGDGVVVEAHRPPNLNVTLWIKGKFMNIHRERKQGERTDKMRLQTGKMQIIIGGSIIGGSIKDESSETLSPSETLSILLNRLQQLLKERFSYIEVQVA